MELVAIELNSCPDIYSNFAQVEQQLKCFRTSHPKTDALVVLPECFAIFGGSPRLNIEHMESIGEGVMSQKLSALARTYRVYLVGGTIPTRCKIPEKFQASTLVFDPEGKLLADYQKMHLFDVDVADNTRSYRESDTTEPGQSVVSVDIQGITVGLAVCYDVRFAGLFGQLRQLGADVVVLPSAFTVPTGEAHWHHLLCARAIENQVFMVAAGQAGVHQNGRETFGHSLIVDPWGGIVAEYKKRGPGWVSWTFDQQQLDKVRRQMPIDKHNRFAYNLTR